MDTDSPEEFAWRMRHYTPRVWVTPVIIGLNATVFLLMVVAGVNFLAPSPNQLVAWGGNAGVLSLGAGQSWRLFTSMFLHAGIIHIGMNMVVLWNIGPFIERLIGHVGMVVAYLLSGLVGSLASAVIHPQIVSVGASGAIFGLYGVLLGFLLRQRHSVPPPVLRRLRNSGGAFVLYNLVFSAAVPGIDISAHLGGLVGGFLIGIGISAPLNDEAVRGRAWRNAVVAVAGTSVIALAAWALRSA